MSRATFHSLMHIINPSMNPSNAVIQRRMEPSPSIPCVSCLRTHRWLGPTHLCSGGRDPRGTAAGFRILRDFCPRSAGTATCHSPTRASESYAFPILNLRGTNSLCALFLSGMVVAGRPSGPVPCILQSGTRFWVSAEEAKGKVR